MSIVALAESVTVAEGIAVASGIVAAKTVELAEAQLEKGIKWATGEVIGAVADIVSAKKLKTNTGVPIVTATAQDDLRRELIRTIRSIGKSDLTTAATGTTSSGTRYFDEYKSSTNRPRGTFRTPNRANRVYKPKAKSPWQRGSARRRSTAGKMRGYGRYGGTSKWWTRGTRRRSKRY